MILAKKSQTTKLKMWVVDSKSSAANTEILMSIDVNDNGIYIF